MFQFWVTVAFGSDAVEYEFIIVSEALVCGLVVLIADGIFF